MRDQRVSIVADAGMLGRERNEMISDGELRSGSQRRLFKESLIQIEIRWSFRELLLLLQLDFRHGTNTLFNVIG